MSPYDMSEKARWYVVHTYSGYENKVKATIEKSVENRNLQHLVMDIQVPMEQVIEELEKTQSDEPLALLAQKCGFSDIYHFTHCFTRHFGQSPSAYRKDTR